jgi:adenylate cyclase
MGFEARFDYSCIGDTVNVASRIEGACKIVCYDILVTAETRAAAPELAYLSGGALFLKGLSQPEPIHLLIGSETLASSSEFRALADAHAALLAAWAVGATASPLLAQCRAAAAPLDSRLVDFYDACPGRLADFQMATLDVV